MRGTAPASSGNAIPNGCEGKPTAVPSAGTSRRCAHVFVRACARACARTCMCVCVSVHAPMCAYVHKCVCMCEGAELLVKGHAVPGKLWFLLTNGFCMCSGCTLTLDAIRGLVFWIRTDVRRRMPRGECWAWNGKAWNSRAS